MSHGVNIVTRKRVMQHEEGGKSICREEFVFVFEIISFGIRRLIATQREIAFDCVDNSDFGYRYSGQR